MSNLVCDWSFTGPHPGGPPPPPPPGGPGSYPPQGPGGHGPPPPPPPSSGAPPPPWQSKCRDVSVEHFGSHTMKKKIGKVAKKIEIKS